MKNKIKRRLDALEEATTLDGSKELYLGFPLDDNQYRVKKVYPVTDEDEIFLTEEGFEVFTNHLDGRMIEIQWTEVANENIKL